MDNYLDVHGSKQGLLFIKELSVGVGGGICVLFSRYLPSNTSNIMLGIFGVLLIITTALLLIDELKTIKHKQL
jgi:hypothetical protein